MELWSSARGHPDPWLSVTLAGRICRAAVLWTQVTMALARGSTLLVSSQSCDLCTGLLLVNTMSCDLYTSLETSVYSVGNQLAI